MRRNSQAWFRALTTAKEFCVGAVAGVDKLNNKDHAWAFDKMSPMRRISAIELFGAIVLVKHMMKHSQGALADITFEMRKQYAKKWPNSGLMMELASLQHASGIEVQP